MIYTDGADEIFNESNEHLGLERFTEILKQHVHLPAQEMCDAVYRSVWDFKGSVEQYDDFTLVVLKSIE